MRSSILGLSKYIGMYLSFVLLRHSNNTLFRLEILSDTSDRIDCRDWLRLELINMHVTASRTHRTEQTAVIG